MLLQIVIHGRREAAWSLPVVKCGMQSKQRFGMPDRRGLQQQLVHCSKDENVCRYSKPKRDHDGKHEGRRSS